MLAVPPFRDKPTLRGRQVFHEITATVLAQESTLWGTAANLLVDLFGHFVNMCDMNKAMQCVASIICLSHNRKGCLPSCGLEGWLGSRTIILEVTQVHAHVPFALHASSYRTPHLGSLSRGFVRAWIKELRCPAAGVALFSDSNWPRSNVW